MSTTWSPLSTLHTSKPNCRNMKKINQYSKQQQLQKEDRLAAWIMRAMRESHRMPCRAPSTRIRHCTGRTAFCPENPHEALQRTTPHSIRSGSLSARTCRSTITGKKCRQPRRKQVIQTECRS